MTATNAYHLWLPSLSLTSVSLVADILAVRSEKSERAVLLTSHLTRILRVAILIRTLASVASQINGATARLTDSNRADCNKRMTARKDGRSFSLTGLRNNVWNYVAEKRSREVLLGGEDLEPARGRKLNRFKPQVSSRPFLFSTNTL